jgi:superfamily II DNA or RNA helicase
MTTLADPPKVFTPRPYQTEAEQAVNRDWASGLLRLLISLPTGMGKTVILTNITKQVVARNDRVLVFVNRNELVDQTVETMQAIIPGADVGVIQGVRRDYGAQIIVASIATMGRSPLTRAAIGRVGLIIVDECHHGPAETYVQSIRDLGGFRDVPVLGVTATPVHNTLGMGDLWQRVSYSRDIGYAFKHHYLVLPDFLPLYKRGVNLEPAHLAQVWKREAAQQLGMVITDTVANAEAIRDAFRARGIPAEVIEGELPSVKRKRIYANTRRGINRVLISVSCLTEGFDMPELTFLMIARSIGSQNVYVQIVGRVLRLHKGKTVATIADMTGASAKWATRQDPYGLTVRPSMSKSAPGKRKPKPVEGIRYKVRHTVNMIGIPVSIVTRIEGKNVTTLKTLRWGSTQRREQKAHEVVRADQLRAAMIESGERSALKSWLTSGFDL